jgi:F-type H+-transporting ATPase subunit delta
MQLSDRALSWRYARAFFLSALDRGEEGNAASQLTQAYRALRDKMQVFQHPRVTTPKKKIQMRQIVAGSISQHTARFLELLIDKKRFHLLPHLVADIHRICDEHQGVIRAVARSASQLSEPEIEAIRQKLGTFCGKQISLEARVDPDILAGVVVRMGDWVFDASLQGRLKNFVSQIATRN